MKQEIRIFSIAYQPWIRNTQEPTCQKLLFRFTQSAQKNIKILFLFYIFILYYHQTNTTKLIINAPNKKKIIIKYCQKNINHKKNYKYYNSTINIKKNIIIKKTTSNCSCIQLGTFNKGINANKNKMFRKI